MEELAFSRVFMMCFKNAIIITQLMHIMLCTCTVHVHVKSMFKPGKLKQIKAKLWRYYFKAKIQFLQFLITPNNNQVA